MCTWTITAIIIKAEFYEIINEANKWKLMKSIMTVHFMSLKCHSTISDHLSDWLLKVTNKWKHFLFVSFAPTMQSILSVTLVPNRTPRVWTPLKLIKYSLVWVLENSLNPKLFPLLVKFGQSILTFHCQCSTFLNSCKKAAHYFVCNIYTFF